MKPSPYIKLIKLEQMLTYVDSETDRAEWVSVLMAIKSEFGESGKAFAQDWSASASNYDKSAFNSTWKSIRSSGGVGIGSLIYKAKENGFRFEALNPVQARRLNFECNKRKAQQAEQERLERERLDYQYLNASKQACQVLQNAKPAPINHPYLNRKKINPHGVLFGSVLGYQDALIIPVYGTQAPFVGKYQSLQFIQSGGLKRFLTGSKKTGGYYPIQWKQDVPILICEGFATGATLAQHYTPDLSVISAFDAGNLLNVAKSFRQQYPLADIIIAGDNDHQTERNTGINTGKQKALFTANEIQAGLFIPEFAEHEQGSDWNDRYLLDVLKNNPSKQIQLGNELGGAE